jgi:hypothetical protein
LIGLSHCARLCSKFLVIHAVPFDDVLSLFDDLEPEPVFSDEDFLSILAVVVAATMTAFLSTSPYSTKKTKHPTAALLLVFAALHW